MSRASDSGKQAECSFKAWAGCTKGTQDTRQTGRADACGQGWVDWARSLAPAPGEMWPPALPLVAIEWRTSWRQLSCPQLLAGAPPHCSRRCPLQTCSTPQPTSCWLFSRPHWAAPARCPVSTHHDWQLLSNCSHVCDEGACKVDGASRQGGRKLCNVGSALHEMMLHGKG